MVKDIIFSIICRPLLVSSWSNPMPFWQQLFGQLAVVMFTTIRHYWSYPQVRKVLNDEFDETVGDLADLERTSSIFLLSDDYRVFNYQSPKVADVIEIGCVHCVPAKPLPKVGYTLAIFYISSLIFYFFILSSFTFLYI